MPRAKGAESHAAAEDGAPTTRTRLPTAWTARRASAPVFLGESRAARTSLERMPMSTASILLVAIGLLGAFDVAWFHTRRARLTARPECRREAWLHVVRGVVYAAQFLLVPNVRFAGAWVLALGALFVVDATVAALDVLEEPRSREAQGGLPAGEYLMHVVLSVLVGAMLHAVASDAWAARALPTSVTLAANAPAAVRALLAAMAVGSAGVALVEALALVDQALPRPRPLHVSVRLPATTARVWKVTHDHVLHPRWDHRFDRITMHDARITTGTRMTYEKTVLGMTVRGWGRYELHAPVKQSTFAFGADDARSLIREGVGVWRYRDVSGETGEPTTELSTSYTYEVRWGLFGRLFDRLVFRPLFQRETERSFARLAREVFGVTRPVVLGATGRKRTRFAQPPAAQPIASRRAAGCSVA